MNGAVCVTRSMIWVVMLCFFVACSIPTSPASPDSPSPSPGEVRQERGKGAQGGASDVASPLRILRTPTPLPATPMPRTLSPTVPSVTTPILLVVPPLTPQPRQFDEVDTRALLSTLFSDCRFTPADDAFRVNDDPNWTMWVTSRAEGQFTRGAAPELAAIVANDVPSISTEQAKRNAPWGSFLVIFLKRDGRLSVTQRAFLFPTAISPQTFDVQIDRATDFDHDGQNELLIVTSATALGMSTSAAFLYQWEDPAFVEIWSATIGEDNTGTLNQLQYYTSTAEIRVMDVDGDGIDEIVVEGTRVDYAHDAQGLPDTDHEIARRRDRRVYRWNGATFALDPARATPLPPLLRTP